MGAAGAWAEGVAAAPGVIAVGVFGSYAAVKPASAVISTLSCWCGRAKCRSSSGRPPSDP
jgi:hypothetical protein